MVSVLLQLLAAALLIAWAAIVWGWPAALPVTAVACLIAAWVRDGAPSPQIRRRR